ncbi:MAG: ABC transporter ATP-binding protein [Fimbriimonadaceae bacterium]|nr:ABC transporter ATP-binding protein [Fimbriimonadaceae bacterium]
MLKVEGLGKRFGPRWIFRGLNFELGTGDALIVLGQNGSGKSTLLKTLCGLLSASEGNVILPDGDPRLTLGVSALDMALYPHLTPTEHLELSADLRGCSANSGELLKRVNLTSAADRPCAKLSTGMRNRLKLALAIQTEPKLLMLDEPGASLDEEGRALIESICEEQRIRGVLVIATNDPTERRLGNLELRLEA